MEGVLWNYTSLSGTDTRNQFMVLCSMSEKYYEWKSEENREILAKKGWEYRVYGGKTGGIHSGIRGKTKAVHEAMVEIQVEYREL